MPTFQKGDVWVHDGDPDSLILIPSNGVLGRKGLIMGAGFAKQAAERHPELPAVFGTLVGEFGKTFGSDKVFEYGLLFFGNFGLFQTKFHWRHGAGLLMIQQSRNLLRSVASQAPQTTFHLPYPGIGLGGLDEYVVRPVVETLPDNVHIWTL